MNFLRFPQLLFLFISAHASAQQTLVRSAPNDSFDLALPRYNITVSDFAITRGQHAVPMNLKKPVATNLLEWKYFDEIVAQNVVTPTEPIWTKRSQLIDEVAPDLMLSLHINLELSDTTTGQLHRIFMVIGGLTKGDLKEMPLESSFDADDTYAPRRFAAIAMLMTEDGKTETYDCIEGYCTLEQFEPKKGRLGGRFEFLANRIGKSKRGFFTNGTFGR